jgi:hydrogenase-4 component F
MISMNEALPILLIAFPLATAVVTYAIPSARIRPFLVPITAIVHFALAVAAIASREVSSFGGWLMLDQLGRIVLLETSGVFTLAALYAPGYLLLWPDRQNRAFCAGLLVFLSMMSLMVQSHHLGLMWVALETLTLTSAPLVYFKRNPSSLEATWKYLLIGSVGIAIALLGSFFLAFAAFSSGLHSSLLFEDLVKEAPMLSKPWLHSAFIFLFVGYGTKMGLAPMHTWKPDAYGEAPGLVGVVLAGCATSCAYLAVLRFYAIARSAGEIESVDRIMIAIGLLSMLLGAIFMARQRDYKRLLAYSSVEHMGILVLGVGIGGGAIFGSLLHLLTNGFTKGALFLSAGNIHRAYQSKLAADVTGALRRVPFSAMLFVAGFLAITATPPFGVFISELTIVRAAFERGQIATGVLFLVAIAVAFVSMGSTVLKMVQGAPSTAALSTEADDHLRTVLPIALFLLVSLLLGVYIPEPLSQLLSDASSSIGGTP